MKVSNVDIRHLIKKQTANHTLKLFYILYFVHKHICHLALAQVRFDENMKILRLKQFPDITLMICLSL